MYVSLSKRAYVTAETPQQVLTREIENTSEQATPQQVLSREIVGHSSSVPLPPLSLDA